MAQQYYYLIASLPNLVFEHETKGFNFQQLKEFVCEGISTADCKWVDMLFAPIDNQNILNSKLYTHLPFVEGGKFTEQEIIDQLERPDNFPPYISNFLKKLNKTEDEQDDEIDSNEDELIVNPEKLLYQQFYDYTEKSNNNFIRQWFRFDRELRNIQSAFIARKTNTSIESYLVGNDDINELLTKSNASDFGLRRERDYIDKLFQALETDDVLERERKLDLLRWWYVDEITTFNYFDINVVLAFLQKASIIHRWMKLDVDTGIAMFEQLVGELKQTYDTKEAFKEVN